MRCGHIIGCAVLLAACAPRLEHAPAEVTDDFGIALLLDTAPARIVSLNPTTTEILFAVGAGDRLVGRSQYDSWPDSARAVPSLGPALRPNIEVVLAARPDLVLLYASEDNRQAAERLRASGVAAAALRIDRIEEFRRATRLIGRLVGDTIRAAAVVDSVDRTLDRVRAATAGRDRPSVFLHMWERPLITIGGGSFLDELVTIAGGRNVYGDHASPSPTVTLEDVVRRNPDLILVGPITADRLRADSRWRPVRAVREGRVAVFDTTVVGRPSVVMGEAAVAIARLLHPGALP